MSLNFPRCHAALIADNHCYDTQPGWTDQFVDMKSRPCEDENNHKPSWPDPFLNELSKKKNFQFYRAKYSLPVRFLFLHSCSKHPARYLVKTVQRKLSWSGKCGYTSSPHSKHLFSSFKIIKLNYYHLPRNRHAYANLRRFPRFLAIRIVYHLY